MRSGMTRADRWRCSTLRADIWVAELIGFSMPQWRTSDVPRGRHRMQLSAVRFHWADQRCLDCRLFKCATLISFDAGTRSQPKATSCRRRVVIGPDGATRKYRPASAENVVCLIPAAGAADWAASSSSVCGFRLSKERTPSQINKELRKRTQKGPPVLQRTGGVRVIGTSATEWCVPHNVSDKLSTTSKSQSKNRCIRRLNCESRHLTRLRTSSNRINFTRKWRKLINEGLFTPK